MANLPALIAVPLLTRGEVSAWLRVKPLTVTEWARNRKLRSVRTLGGHRRYAEDDVSRISRGEDPAVVYRTSVLAGRP